MNNLMHQIQRSTVYIWYETHDIACYYIEARYLCRFLNMHFEKISFFLYHI